MTIKTSDANLSERRIGAAIAKKLLEDVAPDGVIESHVLEGQIIREFDPKVVLQIRKDFDMLGLIRSSCYPHIVTYHGHRGPDPAFYALKKVAV